MSQFRLVALVLLVAAGCYKDAPDSTLPEPQYFSGPPGGSMDPGSSYDPAPQRYETDERAEYEGPAEQDPDDAPAPDYPDPDGADDAADDAYDAEDLAQAPAAPPPGDPTAGVTDGEIETTLDGYGQWIDTPDYGPVWRPDATVVGVDFTPYETAGSWAYTDAGWAFTSDYGWGWLPFHYGRWGWFHDYWAWVPGYQWGPAWVEWRYGSGVVGWRPLRPQIRDHRHSVVPRFSARAQIRDHRRPRQHTAHWRFATESNFGRPRIRSHLYGNLAEGLRVTSTVNAPPVRARATIRSGDLMRDRFATGRSTLPGRQGGIRDHRSTAPARTYPDAYRPPIRTQPYAPARAYDATRGDPSVRTAPPVRTYQPPAGGAPPVRMHQPPARTYQPPVRSAPPVRMNQPPVRYHQAPARIAPPARGYAPPVRTYTPSAPPARYTPSAPPARYTPSAPPARYTPSAPPARSYTPSAPPARSYTPSAPPARSNDSHRASPAPRSHSSSHGRHR